MGEAGEEEPMQGPVNCYEERTFVSVRLRPLNHKEIARNDVSDWECIDDNTIVYTNNLSVAERSMYPTSYTFNRVFSSDCTTRKVYEEGIKEVVLSGVAGINSSVFAYGQTSSGKTYTMTGITEYAMTDIYDYMERHEEREFTLKFSAMEIYNESVRDLLSADSTPLRVLDDPERGTIVEKLTEETLEDWSHFKRLLSICEAQRQMGETSLNETSSRSHQILRLTIESSACEFLGNGKSNSLAATVNFVDLAGSERASQTLSDGTRLKEGSHINRSLLTLGTVIRKLSKGRNGHIPFRDSKLTRILQSSLGGNARTAIVCTMSPARMHVEQSRNTLLFACCAKEVTTNAQVNIVMSDKALVKHLQRELSRLENELRSSEPTSPTPNFSALLEEKDLEIEKLKKEVIELAHQRDLARSQVEDLRQGAQNDRPSTADQSHLYPRLRVRNSLDYGSPKFPVLANPDNPDVEVNSSGSSPYSDRDSSTSYDENFFNLSDLKENIMRISSSAKQKVSVPSFIGTDLHDEEIEAQTEENGFQLSDLKENLLCTSSSPQPNVSVPNFIGTDLHQEIDAQNEENGEDPHRDVRCIKMQVSTKRYEDSNMLESSQNRYGDSNRSSDVHPSTSELADVEKEDRKYQEFGYPLSKEQKEWKNIHPDSATSTPRKPSWLEKYSSSSSSLKLTKSRSCKASLMTNLFSHGFENDEKNESTPPIRFEKDYTGKPGGIQRNISALKSAVEEKLSRNGSQSSVKSAPSDDLKEQNVGTSSDAQQPEPVAPAKNVRDVGLNPISEPVVPAKNIRDVGLNPMPIPEPVVPAKNVRDVGLDPMPIPDNLTSQDVGLAPIPEPVVPVKNVRDVGLDPIPIPGNVTSPSNWPSEFNRLQREIIELWHACNVSLVHRTYFFLLFKGDPKDSIYMEVEHRRLSFLKDAFSKGTPIVEDGRTVIPSLTSSLKALREERHMLSQKMKKKLSKEQRQNLFLKWNIGVKTKHRRSQLAHRLWTDTGDLNHITESASVVAQLVSFVQPEQAFKEMFSLNFAPGKPNKKPKHWKRSVMSLL